ncbi:MAG: DNA polymerase Y family protein [Verrucomicrobiae bacterium]|nr:DNA polymerase Y family protein [Verrucomicrobiae bacterium]
MFAALSLPDFFLQARLRTRPALHWEAVGILELPPESRRKSRAIAPASVFDRDRERLSRVVEMSPSAADARVERGMTAAQARARCAHLHLLLRDEAAETEAQDLLLDCAAGLAADFESTAPGLVTVDLRTLPPAALATPALEKLGAALVARLSDHELRPRVGFAPNPDLAAVAARVADPVGILRGDADRLRERLAPLPLDLIDPPPDYRGILTLWGVGTLGEFAALPRDEVAERLGPDAGELWDRAAGRHRRLLRLVRPPADFSLTHELDGHTVDTLEPLLFLLRGGLETLTTRLAAAYLAASEIHLALLLADGGVHSQILRVPDSSRDPDLLLGIVHTRLEQFVAGRPIRGYRLELTAARPGEQPFHLFESTLRDPNRFAETLGHLESLLGSGNVGSPAPLDTHRPDAFQIRPFDPASGPTQQGMVDDPTLLSPSAPPPGLPLRRFRPPITLDLAARPDPATGLPRPVEILAGPVTGRPRAVAGPWKLSGDWWERETRWDRLEWDLQFDDGSIYRVSRHADTGGAEPAWVLEGVYG